MSLGNPFMGIARDNNIYIREDSITVRKEAESIWSEITDRDIISAASRLFGIQCARTRTLRSLDKEAFLTLCFDLWEEAHGKS